MKFRGDRQISIYTTTEARSASGAVTETEVLHLSAWADVKETGGTEKEEDNKTTAMATTSFFIRYYAGITAKMYIEYDGYQYDILGVNEIERNQFLELKTERKEALNG